MEKPIFGMVTEEQLMNELNIDSRVSLWKLRKEGKLTGYQFASMPRTTFYDIDEVKEKFQPKKK